MTPDHETSFFAGRLEWALTVTQISYNRILDDHAEVGPSLVQIPVQLMPGASIQKLRSQQEDITFHMGLSSGIRVTHLHDRPGCALFEIPRPERTIPDITELPGPPENIAYPRIALGVMSDGSAYDIALDKLPHLLVAGSSGSGKSTFVRSIAYQLVHHYTANQIDLVIIDGKGGSDYAAFKDADHLREQSHFCVDRQHALDLLEDIVDRRLEQRKEQFFAKAKTMTETQGRNVSSLRELGCWDENPPSMRPLIIILDELAEIEMASTQEQCLGSLLTRFTQSARALGGHLIAATQRPSSEVVRGDFKANCARLACRVASGQDSRMILDEAGAENLLDQGDLLFRSPEEGLLRLQAFRA